MRAVVIHEHGDPKVLKEEEYPTPEIGPEDVLVKVKACGVNQADLMIRRGDVRMYPKLPHILGSEISGVIHSVGSAVTQWKGGERVIVYPGFGCGHCEFCVKGHLYSCNTYKYFGTQMQGTYSEFVKAPWYNMVPLPEEVSFIEGAAIPMVMLTAWHMVVDQANVRPGETVLVHAAGSGIGSASIQIAKLCGATVITTAGSDDKEELARSLGASHFINYRTTDFREEVGKITNKRGVDVVIEHTGEFTWDKSVRSLVKHGRLVVCGATSGHNGYTDIRYVFYKHLNIIGSTLGTIENLKHALKYIAEGKIRTVVDRVYPISEVRKAHEIMEARQNKGKQVLQMWD